MDSLPPELVYHVLSTLPALDLVRFVSPVCKDWREIAVSLLRRRLLVLSRANDGNEDEENTVRIVFHLHVVSTHATYIYPLTFSHFLPNSPCKALFLFPPSTREGTNPIIVPLDEYESFANVYMTLSLKASPGKSNPNKNNNNGPSTYAGNRLERRILTDGGTWNGLPRYGYQIYIATGHDRVWKDWWSTCSESSPSSEHGLPLQSLRTDSSLGHLRISLLHPIDLHPVREGGGGERGFRFFAKEMEVETARAVVGLEMELEKRKDGVALVHVQGLPRA
ncbi:hypothetical protein BT69DRAFT_1287021, partial [Atractiella rhizophila]